MTVEPGIDVESREEPPRQDRSLTDLRKTVLILLGALSFSAATGPLTVSLVAIIAVWAPVLDRRSLAGGLGRACLLVGAYGGTVMVLGPLAGVRITYAVSFISVVVLAVISVLHRQRAGAGLRWRDSVHMGALAGPTLLLGSVLASIVRYGSVPAWAMGGDARNHLLWTQFLDSDGGWASSVTYPAFANALSAWVNDRADSTDLLAGIQSQALLWLTFLCAFSLLSGMLASQGPAPNGLRSAVGSLVAISPLVLGQLAEGFFPLALVCLATLSVAAAVLSPRVSHMEFLLYSALGTLIVAATFPPMAPVVAFLAIGARLPTLKLAAARSLAIAGAALATCALILAGLSRSDLVVSTLSLSGASLDYSEMLLTALISIAFLNFLSNQTKEQWLFVVSLGLALAGLILVLLWLESLSTTGATAYYWSKTLMVGFSALLPLALGTSATDSLTAGALGNLRTLWLTASSLALVVTYVPIFFASAPKMPVLKIAQGWFLPSAEEAGLVFEIETEDPTAVEWGTFEPETDRRINIWLGSGRSVSGDRNLGDEGYAWAYGGDMVNLGGFCDLLTRRSEMDLYVDTSAQAELALAACSIEPQRVHIVGAP